jgi:hypothetical protein
MLLFAPLGLLEMKSALLVWYLVQGAFAIATVVLLARLFLRDQGALGFAVAAGLVALLPSARSTVWFAQSNFMALTLFLLFYRDRERPRAGLWVALGVVVKPYFVFFLAYLLLRRAYRTLSVAALCLALAGALATLMFGLTPMLSFLRESPSARVPGYIYGEPMNQSLLGTLLRFSTGTLDGSLLRQPWYFGLALAIVVASAWIVRRAGEDRLGRGELATLLVALLLYPGTLAHYSVLLLAPLLAIGEIAERSREERGEPSWHSRWSMPSSDGIVSRPTTFGRTSPFGRPASSAGQGSLRGRDDTRLHPRPRRMVSRSGV